MYQTFFLQDVGIRVETKIHLSVVRCREKFRKNRPGIIFDRTLAGII
jgi:hypothetical protein